LQKYQGLRTEASEELSRREEDRLRRCVESEPGTLRHGLSNRLSPMDFAKDVYARRQAQRINGKKKKNKRKRKSHR